MNMKRFGKTGALVSELCLGTMTFGWQTDEDAAMKIMTKFAEEKGNFIDTAGIPLYKYIGDTKGSAEVGVSIGMDELESMKERARDAVKKGYKRIKVKIRKGMEEKIVSSVRSTIGEYPMSVDANTDYTLDDTDSLKALDKYNLKYIEQPLSYDDLIDHSYLASKISTPICLDESITSFDKARKAISINACKVINIKPGRVAGFTESLKIAKYSHDHGIHVWIGGMLETGIGRAFNVSLA